MKRLCVFCGSRSGTSTIYMEAATQLGRVLVERGWGLVFGGGHVGMMGAVADAALAAGGEVDGVIPQGLVDRELAHERCTRLHVTRTMHERKALMERLSDAFVALPGGYGTFDELFEMLTWAQLGQHHKPVALLNVAHYFDGLLAFVDHAVGQGFVKPAHRRLLHDTTNVAEVFDALQSAPGDVVPKW